MTRSYFRSNNSTTTDKMPDTRRTKGAKTTNNSDIDSDFSYHSDPNTMENNKQRKKKSNTSHNITKNNNNTNNSTNKNNNKINNKNSQEVDDEDAIVVRFQTTDEGDMFFYKNILTDSIPIKDITAFDRNRVSFAIFFNH